MEKCNKCQREMDIYDFGYVGAVNLKDASCPPASGMIHLCKDCVVGTKYEDVKDGYYYLEHPMEDEPCLVHLYYSSDAQCRGFGFNVHDGCGFMPLSDLSEDSKLTPILVITEEEFEELAESCDSEEKITTWEVIKGLSLTCLIGVFLGFSSMVGIRSFQLLYPNPAQKVIYQMQPTEKVLLKSTTP